MRDKPTWERLRDLCELLDAAEGAAYRAGQASNDPHAHERFEEAMRVLNARHAAVYNAMTCLAMGADMPPLYKSETAP